MAETDNSLKLGVDLDLDEAKKDSKSLEMTLKGLASIFESAFKSAEQSQIKLRGSIDNLNDSVKSLKENIGEVGKQEIAPSGIESATKSAQKGQEELLSAIQKLNGGIETLSDNIKKVGEQNIEPRGLEETERAINEVSPAIENTNRVSKTLGETLKSLRILFLSAFSEGEKSQQKAANSAAKANEAVRKQEILLESLRAKYAQIQNGEIAPKGLKQLEIDARNAEKEFNRLSDEWEKAKERVSSLDFGIETEQLRQARSQFASLGQELSAAGAKADGLNAKLESARLNPTASPDAEKLAAEIGLAEERLVRLRGEAQSAVSAVDFLKQKFFEIPKFIQSAANGIASFGKKALSVFGSIGGAIKKAFTGGSKSTKSFGNVFEKVFNRIKGLAVRVLFFSIITRALRSVLDVISAYIKTNREFADSLRMAQGNLLTAFQPILEVAMPALTALGNGLVYVTGLLVQFVSLLTGKSISSMQSAAKAANSEAKALKGVGKEAKKAKGELYSFDEINKQSAETASGGGGGAEAPIFESPKFDVPDWIKEITLDIKAGNWENVGKTLSDTLMDSLDKVDFLDAGRGLGTKIQSALGVALGFLGNTRLDKTGADIANFINGIFEGVDPKTLGAVIAEFYNRVFGIMKRFAETVKWSEIGRWISSAIMTAVETFNVEQAGESIAKLFNGIVTLMYEIITGIDWARVGAKFGEVINKFFSEFDFVKLSMTIGETVKGIVKLLSEIIVTTNWENVGHSFWEMLTGIDWTGIVFDMAQFLGRAIGGFGMLLYGFIKDAASEIGSFFTHEIEAAGGNVALGLWNGIIKGLGNIASWLKTNIVDPFINGFKEMFGIHSPSTEMASIGDYLIQGLWKGIGDKVDWILGKIRGFGESVLNGIKDFFGIKSPSTVFRDEVGRYLAEGIGDGLEKNTGAVTKAVSGTLDGANAENEKALVETKAIWAVLPGWFQAVVLTPISDALSIFWGAQLSLSENSLLSIQELFGQFPGWFQGSVYAPMVSGMKAFINQMISSVEAFANYTLDAVDAIVASIRSIRISIPMELGGGSVGYWVDYSRMSARLPRLATGDVVQPGKEFLAILGDNKTEQEVVSPISTMKQAFMEAMQEMGGYGGGQREIILKIGEREFGRFVVDLGDRERNRKVVLV